jgi:flagellar basal body-associated protein FliL
MAEEAAVDDVKPVPTNSNKLILVLILANLVGMGGIGAYLVLFQDSGEVEAQAASSADPAEFGPLVEVPTLIVNLSGGQWGRFMRISIQMEAKDEETKPTVEAAIVPIQNRLVIFFSELDPARTGLPGAKAEIAEEVTAAINEVLGTEAVRRVFYTEFVIQ